MNVLRNSVIFVTRSSLQAIPVMWIHRSLASCRTRFCASSSIRSAKKIIEKRDWTFENLPNIICTQQMCSKCEAVDDLCVYLIIVLSVSTRAENTTGENLLITSGKPDHTWIIFMSCHTTLVDTTLSFLVEVLWN